MRILGIDPGTGRLGWAIVEREKGREVLLDSGCIETPAHTPLGHRLALIFTSIDQIIKTHHPDEASVEELFFTKNVTTAISVGEARGVVLLACELNQVPVFGYTPTKIKLGVTGSGSADKKQVAFMVGQLLKGQTLPKLDDTVDAIAAALVHLSNARIGSYERSK